MSTKEMQKYDALVLNSRIVPLLFIYFFMVSRLFKLKQLIKYIIIMID